MPRKPPRGRSRPKIFTLRVTAKEREAIREEAERQGVSGAELIRSSLPALFEKVPKMETALAVPRAEQLENAAA